MIGALALLAASFAADAVVDANERGVVAVVVRTPGGGDAKDRNARALVEAVDRALRRSTGLRAEATPDTPALTEARGDVVAIARELEGTTAEALAIVTLLPATDEALRVSMLFVDLADLRARIAGVDAASVEERAEPAVARAPAQTVSRGDPSEAERYLEGRVEAILTERIGARPHWGPLAEVDLDCACGGAELLLDGRSLGVVAGERTRLVGVRPGARHLVIDAGGAGRAEVRFIATTSERAQVTLAIDRDSPLRSAMRWGGVGTAVIGGALLVASAALAASHTPTLECGDATGRFASCPAAPFARLGEGGPAAAPLGYAALTAGLTWWIGPELIETEGAPWLSLAIGTTIGLASYFVSVQLEPAGP